MSELVNYEHNCNSECNPELHPWSYNEEVPVYMWYWGFSVGEFRYGDEASGENQSELQLLLSKQEFYSIIEPVTTISMYNQAAQYY